MNEVDEFEFFEALDRTHIASENLQNALEDHPVLKQHPKAEELYERAVDSLEELYQLIGNLMPDSEEE